MDPAGIVPEVLASQKDPCTSAFLPDGVPGEGLVYAVEPFTQPRLVDVGSNGGCGDGMADYAMWIGTCSQGSFGDTTLFIDRPAPFPICVRGLHGFSHDYIVERVTPTEVVLAEVVAQGLLPVIAVEYKKGRLPHSISLAGLTGPGVYVLRITATDGTTPEVSDVAVFDWNGEKTMVFGQNGKKTLARPSIQRPRVF